MLLETIDAYRRWSPFYDSQPNPLLHLEYRLLSSILSAETGTRILDAGCGTGRWMSPLSAQGANVIGIDLCPEMIARAMEKPGLAGRAAVATLTRIPVSDNAFDVAICSFTLGYVCSLALALGELSRAARFVIVSDLHPDVFHNGWKRSFRIGADSYEIAHHHYSLAHLDQAANHAGLVPRLRIEARIGEPEFEIFKQAGKEDAFESATRFPAVVITAWDRRSG